MYSKMNKLDIERLGKTVEKLSTNTYMYRNDGKTTAISYLMVADIWNACEKGVAEEFIVSKLLHISPNTQRSHYAQMAFVNILHIEDIMYEKSLPGSETRFIINETNQTISFKPISSVMTGIIMPKDIRVYFDFTQNEETIFQTEIDMILEHIQ